MSIINLLICGFKTLIPLSKYDTKTGEKFKKKVNKHTVFQRMRSIFLFGIRKNRNINKQEACKPGKHAKMACIHHFKLQIDFLCYCNMHIQ